VKLTKTKLNATKHTASFSFVATGAPATGFQCRLLKSASHGKAKPSFSQCRSPKKYTSVKGKYTFAVRALSPAGPGAETTKTFTAH
jgi:hypothetical protein